MEHYDFDSCMLLARNLMRTSVLETCDLTTKNCQRHRSQREKPTEHYERTISLLEFGLQLRKNVYIHSKLKRE